MDAAQENLVRLLDIVAELEARVEPLRKQAEKAKQYVELAGQQKQLDKAAHHHGGRDARHHPVHDDSREQHHPGIHKAHKVDAHQPGGHDGAKKAAGGDLPQLYLRRQEEPGPIQGGNHRLHRAFRGADGGRTAGRNRLRYLGPFA